MKGSRPAFEKEKNSLLRHNFTFRSRPFLLFGGTSLAEESAAHCLKHTLTDTLAAEGFSFLLLGLKNGENPMKITFKFFFSWPKEYHYYYYSYSYYLHFLCTEAVHYLKKNP